MVTRAFVLSGGASLGAVQVGMLQALTAAGIRPDLVVGTSVGALNGAWIAGRPDDFDLDGLAQVWLHLRRATVFPTRPLLGLRGFLGKADHLVPPDGLRALAHSHAGFARLEDAPIPFSVVATDATTGAETVFDSGPTIDTVVASASIPGVLPPVRIGASSYVDGGVCNNTPISVAVELGATEVWALPTGHACSLHRQPRSALAMILHAVTLLVHQQLVNDIARFEPLVDLRVAPPLCPLDVSPTDFSQAAMLIERARASTADWLARGEFGDNTGRLLEAHSH
jgi:NTE family protein